MYTPAGEDYQGSESVSDSLAGRNGDKTWSRLVVATLARH